METGSSTKSYHETPILFLTRTREISPRQSAEEDSMPSRRIIVLWSRGPFFLSLKYYTSTLRVCEFQNFILTEHDGRSRHWSLGRRGYFRGQKLQNYIECGYEFVATFQPRKTRPKARFGKCCPQFDQADGTSFLFLGCICTQVN